MWSGLRFSKPNSIEELEELPVGTAVHLEGKVTYADVPGMRFRKGFPHQEASVHEEGRRALAASIRNFFHRTEGRGNNCLVETFRRGELDYFFAYPEDYSQRSLEWVEGEFAPRPHNPAFEVIYVYSQRDGTLDLNFRGSYK